MAKEARGSEYGRMFHRPARGIYGFSQYLRGDWRRKVGGARSVEHSARGMSVPEINARFEIAATEKPACAGLRGYLVFREQRDSSRAGAFPCFFVAVLCWD